MDLLRWVFLESTLALCVLLGLSLFVLLVYWRRTLKVRPLLIGLACSVVLLIVHTAVETPRETAEAVLDPIIEDLSHSRTNVLGSALSADFRADDMNPDAFVAYVRRWLEKIDVYTARSSSFEIRDHIGERFGAVATYVSNLAVRGEGVGYVTSTWEFEFVRVNRRWKIARIRPIEILNQKMRDWKQVDSLR
jgi:hypothetical protein